MSDNIQSLYVLVVGCHVVVANQKSMDYGDYIKYNESTKRKLETGLLAKLGDPLTGVRVHDLEDVDYCSGAIRENPMDWLRGGSSPKEATRLFLDDPSKHNDICGYIKDHRFPRIDLLVAVERQEYCARTRCRGESLEPSFDKGLIRFASEVGVKSVTVSDYGVKTIEKAIRDHIQTFRDHKLQRIQ